MRDSRINLIGLGLLMAGTVAYPAWAQSCKERIAELETEITAKQEGAGPAITGTPQPSASGDTSLVNPPADASSRIPANRPAAPDVAAAQSEAASSARTPAEPSSTVERLPANRPAPPETAGPESAALPPAPMNRAMAALAEAKTYAEQGREADCMRALPKIAGSPATK